MDSLERCTNDAAMALYRLREEAGICRPRMTRDGLTQTEDALWMAIFAATQQISALERLVKVLQQERLKDQTTDAVEIRR